MSPQKILVQLDPDAHASVFDAVVAIDSGVDRLLQYDRVEPDQVRDLVHGAIFTRRPQDLQNTAIFIGGTNVAVGEQLLKQVQEAFFGPMRVSVLLDSNGCNTTAAAAVLAAAKHVPLGGAQAVVLGGTGPVGQRVARLLAAQGAAVRVVSRGMERAVKVCEAISRRVPTATLTPLEAATVAAAATTLSGTQIVIAAGAAGALLLSKEARQNCSSLRVAIDLNAVPPLGIEGIEVTDKSREREGALCYGAIGIGGTKMKIHLAAIQRLFSANNFLLDAEEILAIGQTL